MAFSWCVLADKLVTSCDESEHVMIFSCDRMIPPVSDRLLSGYYSGNCERIFLRNFRNEGHFVQKTCWQIFGSRIWILCEHLWRRLMWDDVSFEVHERNVYCIQLLEWLDISVVCVLTTKTCRSETLIGQAVFSLTGGETRANWLRRHKNTGSVPVRFNVFITTH